MLEFPGERLARTPPLLAMNVTTIVLIHGLWMTALSWEHWVRHYCEQRL